MKYDPTVPYGATLTSLDETMGFWIEMNTPATLTVGGTAPGTSEIPINHGWNMPGFPASANLPMPDAISLHGLGSDAFLVFAYHGDETPQWKKFDSSAPDYVNTLTELEPGYGYWIEVGGDHTWEVSY